MNQKRGVGSSGEVINPTILKRLLSIPTSPYREHLVVEYVTEIFEAADVPYFEDSMGNIVVGVANAREYAKRLRAAKSRDPLRIFVAHMDHPGFHGEKWLSPRRLRAKWYGGAPTQGLVGTKVWISDAVGEQRSGKIQRVQLTKTKRSIASLEVLLEDADFAHRKAPRLFGGFGFRAPVWQDGSMLYTKAADDLIGVFSILSLALSTRKGLKKRAKNFVGVLTRAEEVGFIGAIGHFDRYLTKGKPKALVVSLEASRTLPGAIVGRGPIVRLGDRMTVFDAGALRVFSELAEQVLPGRHQRRIMDGGSCEATVAVTYGFPAIGISVPLGNYHNQNLEGGPDSRGKVGAAPEFVHLKDIEGQVRLCRALMRGGLDWSLPWKQARSSLRQRFHESELLLRG
ncbi:MAG: hypothetical protein JST16_12305 [Bdellovibrionales bacterium]|nr:hypothetical protein [Bdellovibrionales bacterium]